MSTDRSPDLLEVRVPVATMWTSPDAPRDVDAAAVLDLPDVVAWTSSMDAAVRRGLDGRTLSQLLLGEPVRVLETHGDWVRVVALAQPSSKHPEGYPGWLLRAHLGRPARSADGGTAFVMRPAVTCDLGDGATQQLSFGTTLGLVGVSAGSADVLLPEERCGRIPAAQMRLSEAQAPSYTVEELLSSARQFLGVRYLWGGTSAWGLDCSGLVHLAFRAHGVVLPRDAHDQADADNVQPVPLDEVRPGDLYFFAGPGQRIYHVGFATRPAGDDGARWMLHAPEGGELIEDAPMAPHRVQTLVSAGRVNR